MRDYLCLSLLEQPIDGEEMEVAPSSWGGGKLSGYGEEDEEERSNGETASRCNSETLIQMKQTNATLTNCCETIWALPFPKA